MGKRKLAIGFMFHVFPKSTKNSKASRMKFSSSLLAVFIVVLSAQSTNPCQEKCGVNSGTVSLYFCVKLVKKLTLNILTNT